MVPTRPPRHAFLYKYRPCAPGGLRLQQPGKRNTKYLYRLGEPQGPSAQPPPRRAAKGSADTWCTGRQARGGRGRGVATRRRRTAGAEARGRGRLTTRPTDQGRQTTRLQSPKAAQAAATRGGERRLEEPPLHLYPPRALLVEGRLATWAQSCPPTRPGGPRRGGHARATWRGRAVPQRPLACGGPLRGGGGRCADSRASGHSNHLANSSPPRNKTHT
ncbi:uncharacterized protein LOC123831695 [Phyllostomus hastatus]|uniref:uncharacterized protein LOC123831695 n=1 Tax=Phyllostomus hastatus TaxID=9423 RepID=UPI001E684267|nr:uncharacterized protein LOC123831695 [Phyllostomus hastatus]